MREIEKIRISCKTDKEVYMVEYLYEELLESKGYMLDYVLPQDDEDTIIHIDIYDDLNWDIKFVKDSMKKAIITNEAIEQAIIDTLVINEARI